QPFLSAGVQSLGRQQFPCSPTRPEPPTMAQRRQPFLNELVCSLAAPTQVWSTRSGDIGASGGDGRPAAVGAEGVLHADIRVLSVAELLVDGRHLEHLATMGEDRAMTFASADRQVT